MRDECYSVSVGVIDDLIKELPRPVKDTFIIAFNGHETRIGNLHEANPFCRFFRLMDQMERYDAKIEQSECKLSGRRRRAEEKGEKWGASRVPADNTELVAEIEAMIADIKAVLAPEDYGILERRHFKRFLTLTLECERDARQVEADEKWDAEQRLVARMERQRKLFEQRMGIGGPQ